MVNFEEAQEFWETTFRRTDVALAKSASLERVASSEIAEISQLFDEYKARLGNNPNPYLVFREEQSRLIRFGLEHHGTPEGLQASADYRHNEANPA